jgi:hypothetical protein
VTAEELVVGAGVLLIFILAARRAALSRPRPAGLFPRHIFGRHK